MTFSPLVIGSISVTLVLCSRSYIANSTFSPLVIGSISVTHLGPIVPTVYKIFQSPCHRVNQCNSWGITVGRLISDFQSPCHRVNQCNQKTYEQVLLEWQEIFQSPCHRVNQCNQSPLDLPRRGFPSFQSPCHRVNQCNQLKDGIRQKIDYILSVPLSSGQSV